MLKKLILLLFLLHLFCGAAFSQDPGYFDKYEIDTGLGENIDGTHAKQFTLIGARSWEIRRLILFRVEPTFELFEESPLTMVVVGVTPVARILFSEKETSPFIDLGAGVNLESRRYFVNRDLGDHFAFGLIAGGGIQIDRHWKVFYRFRHLSNAYLFPPNQGIDGQYIIVGYSFN